MPKEEEKAKPARDVFIPAIGEHAQSVRKALNDRRVQDAFIEAIGADPQLVEALSKVTPDVAGVAADWSCCRGNRPKQDLLDIAQSMRRGLKEQAGQ